MKRFVDLLLAVVSVALLVKLTPKSCNRLAFASQDGHIGCVGVGLPPCLCARLASLGAQAIAGFS